TERIVVKTYQELEHIRHSFLEAVREAGLPIQLMPDTLRIFRLHGKIAITSINFTMDNPYHPDTPITQELQMATKDGLRVLLFGRALVKSPYVLPHWQYKAKRNIDRENTALVSEIDDFFFGQQFDHMDS